MRRREGSSFRALPVPPRALIDTPGLPSLLRTWRVLPDCPKFPSRLHLPYRNNYQHEYFQAVFILNSTRRSSEWQKQTTTTQQLGKIFIRTRTRDNSPVVNAAGGAPGNRRGSPGHSEGCPRLGTVAQTHGGEQPEAAAERITRLGLGTSLSLSCSVQVPRRKVSWQISERGWPEVAPFSVKI